MKIKSTVFNLLRISLALLFLFSGFVKCVDPMGGAIKIEDYFVAWGIIAPESLTLTLSLVQNCFEFLAGFLLLFNVFVPFASIVTLCFMVFFTPLTLYIAIANPVSDCGCFGDAVKLTNWQTFYKNLIFLPAAILVFANRRNYTSGLRLWRKLIVAIVGVVVAAGVSLSGLTNEPFIDFRPFSVGTDIEASMTIPPDAPMPEYRTTFILEKDGQQQEFDEHSYPYDDSTWVYIDSRTEVIAEGYQPPIKDFSLTDADGYSRTEQVLHSAQPQVLAISPKVEDISPARAKKLAEIAAACSATDAQFFILTASSGVALRNLTDMAEFPFSYLSADETMLKTITRCNPGLIAVQDGIIVAKYHIDHAPEAEQMVQPAAVYLRGVESQRAHLMVLCTIFAAGLVLAFIFNNNKRYLK